LAGDDIEINTVEAVRNSQIDSAALNDVGFGNCGHFFFLVPFGIAAAFLLNFGQKGGFSDFFRLISRTIRKEDAPDSRQFV